MAKNKFNPNSSSDLYGNPNPSCNPNCNPNRMSRPTPVYRPSKRVCLFTHNLKLSTCRKLTSPFFSPFKLVFEVGSISLYPTMSLYVSHVTHLLSLFVKAGLLQLCSSQFGCIYSTPLDIGWRGIHCPGTPWLLQVPGPIPISGGLGGVQNSTSGFRQGTC